MQCRDRVKKRPTSGIQKVFHIIHMVIHIS